MQLRSRKTIALVVGALMLIGAGIGAGVALAQSPSPSPSPSPSSKEGGKVLRGNAFLDEVARQLGIQRSRLDEALRAQALAEVDWAEDNDFITGARADALRERINAGRAKGLGRIGAPGKFGIERGRFGSSRGFAKGRLHGGSGSLTAAADYLGLSARELREALETKTLAQVARDQEKSVDGLRAALRTARESRLDEAVANGRITQAQANALLARFDSEIGSLINGVPPALTDLAERLGIDRSRLITAIRNAAIAQIDAAVAQELLTERVAEALKERIRSSPAWPLGPGGLRGLRGLCAGIGRMGGLDAVDTRFEGLDLAEAVGL